MRITDILRVGKDNALSAEYLMDVFKISRRKLYAEIAKERCEGALILPDNNGGYYIPDETTECADIVAYHRRMESMAKNTFAAIRSAREAERRHNER